MSARVVEVGQGFGCVGQLLRGADVIAETAARPIGCEHVAMLDALDLARKLGHVEFVVADAPAWRGRVAFSTRAAADRFARAWNLSDVREEVAS